MKKKFIYIFLFIYIFSFVSIIFNNFDYAITSDIIKVTQPVDIINIDNQISTNLTEVSEALSIPMFILESEKIEGTNEYEYNYFVTSNYKLPYLDNMEPPNKDRYLSNVKSDDKNQTGYIPYSNKIRKIYMYNILDYEPKENTNEITLFVPKKASTNELISQLNKYNYEVISDTQNIVIPVNIILNNLFFLVLLFLLVAISILSFFDLHIKKMYIKKLLGYSTSKLVIEYFIKFFKVFLVLLLAVFTFEVIINFYSVKQMIFTTTYNVKYLLIFSLPVILMFLLYSLIVFKQSLIDIIKNKKLKGINTIAVISKFFLIIVCIIIILMNMINLNNLSDNLTVLKNYDYVEDYYVLRSNSKLEDSALLYQLYNNTVNKYDGLLVNSRQIDPKYDLLYANDYYVLEVNENYINKVSPKDINGNDVILSYDKDKKINVLIPKKYANNDDIQYLTSMVAYDYSTDEQIELVPTYIEDDQYFPYFDVTMTLNEPFANPIIFIIDEDTDPQYIEGRIAGSESYFIKATESQITSELKELNLQTKINFDKKEETIEKALELNKKIFMKTTIVIISTFMCLIVTNIALIKVYFNNNRTRIKVKYINGYSLFENHKKLIYGNQLILISALLTVIIFVPILYNNPFVNMKTVYSELVIISVLVYIIDLILLMIFLKKASKGKVNI